MTPPPAESGACPRPSRPRELDRRLARQLAELQGLIEEQRRREPQADWLPRLEETVAGLERAAAALERVSDAARTRRENLLLREIGRRLGSDLTTESLAHLLMDTLSSVVPFDAAGLYFTDARDGLIRWETLRGYDTDKLHLVRQKLDYGIMGWVREHRQAVIVEDVRRDVRYFNARDRTRSELVVPILHEGRVIGFFNFESDLLGAYGEQELALVEVFASQIAQTVERTLLQADRRERQRVQEELRVARVIQQSLLPVRPLELPDLRVSGVNLTSEAVGGDYYDHFAITEDDIGLVIADVAGKGIPASLIMASFRTGLRLLAQHRTDITGILHWLNNHLEEFTEADSFVTGCYGVYNRRSGRLSYVNAGHNPPLLLRQATGDIERLETGGLVLGSFPDSAYEFGIVELASGDSLLFYTDGLNEAEDRQGNEFGIGGIEQALRKARGLDPPALLLSMLEELRRHTGMAEGALRFRDDLTLMAVRRA
jgi:phosphoserine phosphatase RsbU/P